MSNNEWTTSEVAKLKLMWCYALPSELEAAFPRHRFPSIKDMAHRQGFRKGNTRTDTMRKYRKIAAGHVMTFQFRT